MGGSTPRGEFPVAPRNREPTGFVRALDRIGDTGAIAEDTSVEHEGVAGRERRLETSRDSSQAGELGMQQRIEVPQRIDSVELGARPNSTHRSIGLRSVLGRHFAGRREQCAQCFEVELAQARDEAGPHRAIAGRAPSPTHPKGGPRPR